MRACFSSGSCVHLFAVAVFCSSMADLLPAEQGKRLFGFIGAGGTAGALLGPVVTIGCRGRSVGLACSSWPPTFLEAGCVLPSLELARGEHLKRMWTSTNALSAAVPSLHCPNCSRSPHLLVVGRSMWVSLLSLGATITLFRAGANIVAADGARRGRADARLRRHRSRGGPADAWRRRSSPPARFLERFGTGVAAGALPAVYLVGFAALAFSPTLGRRARRSRSRSAG